MEGDGDRDGGGRGGERRVTLRRGCGERRTAAPSPWAAEPHGRAPLPASPRAPAPGWEERRAGALAAFCQFLGITWLEVVMRPAGTAGAA